MKDNLKRSVKGVFSASAKDINSVRTYLNGQKIKMTATPSGETACSSCSGSCGSNCSKGCQYSGILH